jgi:hypothetical protein
MEGKKVRERLHKKADSLQFVNAKTLEERSSGQAEAPPEPGRVGLARQRHPHKFSLGSNSRGPAKSVVYSGPFIYDATAAN